MTKSRKTLSILFFAAAAVVAASGISGAQTQTSHPPRVYFIPILTLPEANQSGDIGIVLSSQTGISAYGFTIDFDPQFIRVDGVRFIDPPSGVSLLKLGPDINNDSGQVTVGALSIERQSLTDELPYTVVQLTVTMRKEGLTHLYLSRVLLKDTNFAPITTFFTTHGTVRTPLPDPRANYLKVNSISTKEGDPLTFSFNYANMGGEDAPQSSYKLLIDDAVVYENRLDEVPLGEARELSLVPPSQSRLTATAGDHVARVIVDPDNQINEADETNNEATVNFTVEAAATPPEVPGLSLTTGWNKTRWSFAPLAVGELLTQFDSQCGRSTALAGSYLRNGWWETYRVGYGGANFSLESGRTYYLQMTKTCTWNPED